MRRYGPKNKFEEIVAGIFALLFYGALFGAGLLILGMTIYKLIVRDWGFFKQDGMGMMIPFSILIIGIVIVIIRANRKHKRNQLGTVDTLTTLPTCIPPYSGLSLN